MLMEELKGLADEKYRDFQLKLIRNPDVQMLGVRTADLRRIAKRYRTEQDIVEVLSYPNETYEIRFILLAVIADWPYEEFKKGMMFALDEIDNWALCDSFIPRCIKGNEDRFFLDIIYLLTTKKEFYERFALVMLIKFYINEDYLEGLFVLAESAHTEMRNVQTAVAWLLSETAAKYYDRCRDYFKASKLDEKTYSLAIRKCCESLRLSQEQKTELKDIKKQWQFVKKSEKSST